MIITVPRHPAKADPALIGPDEHHLARVADALKAQIAELSRQRDALRTAPAGRGTRALERDLNIHRLSARLRLLRRFGVDACLGRMVPAGDPGRPLYVGRLGLADPDGGEPLLVDWRAPASAPFFAATHAHPHGLASRRRYRWSGGRVVDYWDEVFALDGTGFDADQDSPGATPPRAALSSTVTLDDQSAFIASLGDARTPRMRDVLATIQADQDAIIRADARGALVVDGGPGTGKTVVALHRAAYLLYADPRLRAGRGSVLVVGPHQPYLAYTADVLPSLGEEGVRTCTLRDLLPEGASAIEEPDPEVAALKGDARMAAAAGPAVALYEEPPTDDLELETAAGEVLVSADIWAEAFASAGPNTPHNEARDEVWEALLDLLADQHDDGITADEFRHALVRDAALRRTFRRAWPLLEASDLVSDLWAVPAYLRRCAPWLTPDQVRALRRPEGSPWTVADLPVLDALRYRLGDPEASARNRRRRAEEAADRAYMDAVVEDILAADDDPESGLDLLHCDSIRDALVHDDALPDADADPLAGPFAHLIVDEAQELTDAQWQMLLRRCPSRSVTVVGDRAQARAGFAESWTERLRRVGFGTIRQSTLTINYRTPAEVMDAAAPVIRAVLPDAGVPVSVRSTREPVRYGAIGELDAVLSSWLAEHDEGVACVIGTPELLARARRPDAMPEQETAVAAIPPSGTDGDRVSWLAPEQAKGLEFDLVVLVDPGSWGSGVAAAVDRYVAMTRATQRLVILSS
ncbi:MAG: RNA polymerase recycling motor ATPase HelR [Propioniciclava sp.]|uniref:RNA polymerase recycling motor ATPase HelR n=1 Tax=Propioniciclava sp. TaxID=2038686 RepID=UPI0039E5BB50